MIPQRIKLKGFLCYKEEQAIDFDGTATLWMLSGLNGSGKSSIFDALTYALFDHHRGGGRFAVELINKDSEAMLVEFDFLLDGKLHRAKRTLKRDNKGGARGTQQILRFDDGKFEPLPDTGQKGMFDAWVKENVGLNYETFTSSVLLLQGKAEKLLDSKPEGRREVLAGIVDLDRFRKLFDRADEERKTHEATLKSLASKLAALPVVLPLEIQEAKGRIDEADSVRQAGRAEVERLQALEYDARAWQDLQQRMAAARGRYQQARDLLTQSAAIEQAADRLRELREVMPKLNEIVVRRGESHQAKEALEAQRRDREKQGEAMSLKEGDLRKSAEKRLNLHSQIARDEGSFRDVSARLRATSTRLEKLTECERQEADLERLRESLRAYKTDPTSLVETRRQSLDRLEATNRVLPVLSRFRQKRDDLGQAFEKERACETQMKAIQARGAAAKADLEARTQTHADAATALREAVERAASARTVLEQARVSLREVSQLDGSKLCRHCGQELTPGHIDEEKRKRGAAVTQAETQSREATAAQEQARQREEAAAKEKARADEAYQTARGDYRDSQSEHKQAGADIERLQKECAHTHAEVPDEFRDKIGRAGIADWRETTYPTPADMDELKTRIRDLEPTRRGVKEAEKALREWADLKSKETTILSTLERLLRDVPKDRPALRREHADLETQEKALFSALDACREQVKQVERDVSRLTAERDAAQKTLAGIDTRIKEYELTRGNAERVIDAQTKSLPATWQASAPTFAMRELHTLKGEQLQLEGQNTDDRARHLEHARRNLAVLEKDAKDLDTLGEKFSPEARQDPAAIALSLREAKTRADRSDDILGQARGELSMLESRQGERQQVDADYRKVDEELKVHRTLCELLGKDRLQLHLVRQAERQVVDYANAVLDRLSGGQLYIRLSGEAGGDGASAKALDLEAFNRATGERAINVAFLSGSQKFRVAVSLALGIGQYASRRHRPIESVIIDEGFGCLDSQGRQVMIQELQNLRSQMKCILLVSHQEDFAESFSDGYQFRLEDGATRVERFQR
jgi:DNA repair exonuclease SbcCD ATPase subunit